MLDITTLAIEAMESGKRFWVEIGDGFKVKVGVAKSGYILTLHSHDNVQIDPFVRGVDSWDKLNEILDVSFGVNIISSCDSLLNRVNSGYENIHAQTRTVTAGVMARRLEGDYSDRWKVIED